MQNSYCDHRNLDSVNQPLYYSLTLSSIVEILSQFDVAAMEKLKHKSYFRKMDLLLRKHKVSWMVPFR